VPTHLSILSWVYLSQGDHTEAVADLMREAGFVYIVIKSNMRAIQRTQRKNFSLLKGLEQATQHRYAVCACKANRVVVTDKSVCTARMGVMTP
jgi:hypothetical protein